MRGDAALCVHHMDLSVIASHVGVGYRGYNVPRGPPLFQQSQALSAVKWIDQCLCRDRTDARFDVWNERTHSEETSRNGNSELSSVPIASYD
jgi:hypothetical protein